MSTTTPPPATSNVARGLLYDVSTATATKPASIVFHVPGSQYQIHLRQEGSITAQVGKRIIGVIHASARRVDATAQGGRFIEPVIGRPRRIQGVVVAHNAGGGASSTITVDCAGSASVDGVGLPVVCRLTDARQKADQFPIGAIVGFDVLDGATFTQQ